MDEELREAHESEPPGAPESKPEIRPARGRTFLPDVTGVEFSSSRRGYDRAEVDEFVERVSRIVVELEAMRSPDAVIERALADVGEETSAILRRARKAAEEIIADAEAQAAEQTAAAEGKARELREDAEGKARELREDADRYSARVRAEAEEVLSTTRSEADQIRAEAEADGQRVRSEADRYSQLVSTHIDQLAQDRHRLIEDLRKLADQFHRTADRALEQVPSHEGSYAAMKANGAATEAQSH